MKSILLVMDMMNDLIHPDGVNAKTYVVQAQARQLYANTVRAIAAARRAGVKNRLCPGGLLPGLPRMSAGLADFFQGAGVRLVQARDVGHGDLSGIRTPTG